jgi:hypothetical protein
MKTKFPLRYVSLAIASLLVIGCGNSSTKSESDQSPATVVAIEQTTINDPQMAEVESDLASLDADLEVIDQAIADLDSVAP